MAGITFDKSMRYKGANGKTYGKGVWRREDGSIIPMGNRIKNSDGSYLQLNSDGTSTKLYDKGNFTLAGTKSLSTKDKADIKEGKVISKENTSKKTQKYQYPKTIEEINNQYGPKPLQKQLYNLPEFLQFSQKKIGEGPTLTYGQVKDKIVNESILRANNGINYYENIDKVKLSIDNYNLNPEDKKKFSQYTEQNLAVGLQKNARNDLYSLIYNNIYNRTKDNNIAAKIAGEAAFGKTYSNNPSSSYFSLGGSPSSSRIYAIAEAKRLGGKKQEKVFNEKQQELLKQYYSSPEFINSIDLIALKNGLNVDQVLEFLPEEFLNISMKSLTDLYLPTNSKDFILKGLARGINAATSADIYSPQYERDAKSLAIKETKSGNNSYYKPTTFEKGAYTAANALPIATELLLAFNPETTLANGAKYLTKSQIKNLPKQVVNLSKNFGKDVKGLYKEFVIDPKGLTRNVMKAGARKIPELGGDVGGFMLGNSLIERVDDENIRKYGGLALTGTLMGIGRSTGLGIGKILFPTSKGFLNNIVKQGTKSPYIKDAQYAVANNILNNLRFAGAYALSDNLIDSNSYMGEVGKFGLASGLTGLSNWATNRAFNNMLSKAIKDYETRILENNAPQLAEQRILKLQNLDRAINGVDNKINTTPVITKKSISSIIHNPELSLGQKSKQLLTHTAGPATRYFANGAAQGSLGVLNMGLIDYIAPEQLKNNPYYEYAKMNLGNRLGGQMMNTLGYGFRSGSGGETSLSRVAERLTAAASRDKARIMQHANIPLTILKFGTRNNKWSDMLDKKIEANNKRLKDAYKNWTEFTGSQIKVGNLTGYLIKHDNRRKDIEYLKKYYPKIYELLKNGYSTGEFDYTSMDGNGVRYLGTTLEGYGKSLGENATPQEIALSLSGYAGKRHGSLYRNFITDLGLKGLKGFNYRQAEVPIFSKNAEGVMTTEKVPLYIKIGERYYPNPRVKNAAIGERQNDFDITKPFKGPKDKNGNRKEWVILSNVAGHINVPVFNNGPEGTTFTNIKFDTGGYGQTTSSYNSGTGLFTTLPGKLLDDNSARLHIMTTDKNPRIISAYGTQGSVPRLTYNQFIKTVLKMPKLLRNSFIELQISSFGINPKLKAILKKLETNRNRELVYLINELYPGLKEPITAVGGNYKSKISTNYTPGMHRQHIKRMLDALPKSENPEILQQIEKLSKEYEQVFDSNFDIIPERLQQFLKHLREFYQKDIELVKKTRKKKKKTTRNYMGKLIPRVGY